MDVSDGLAGIVVEADAVHVSDGMAMRLFQVVLAPPQGGYYRLIGVARADEAERLLPEFRRMADSFRVVEPK